MRGNTRVPARPVWRAGDIRSPHTHTHPRPRAEPLAAKALAHGADWAPSLGVLNGHAGMAMLEGTEVM